MYDSPNNKKDKLSNIKVKRKIKSAKKGDNLLIFFKSKGLFLYLADVEKKTRIKGANNFSDKEMLVSW